MSSGLAALFVSAVGAEVLDPDMPLGLTSRMMRSTPPNSLSCSSFWPQCMFKLECWVSADWVCQGPRQNFTFRGPSAPIDMPTLEEHHSARFHGKSVGHLL